MNSKYATKKKIKSKCDLGGALWQKVTGILIMTVVGPPCLCQSIQGKIKSMGANVTVTFHTKKLLLLYLKIEEAILDLPADQHSQLHYIWTELAVMIYW